MVTTLSEFEGYTVDERLREFRKVIWKKGLPSIEFVKFDSIVGRKMLGKMLKLRKLI